MSIRCIAVDDEPMALEKLTNYINKIPYLELVAACSCPCEAMQVMSDGKVDALFIDINMPDVNGMDFVKALPDPPLVVFTTAYAEHAAESYKVRAVDYLLKPYSFVDFQRAAEFVRQQHSARQQGNQLSHEDDFLLLKVDYRYVRVKFNDIVFIEGMNENLKVHLVDSDPILVHTTFKQMNGHLPDNFLQVHRSYVINVRYLLELERSTVLLEGGKRIPISDGNKDAVMSYLSRYTLRK